MKKNLKLTVLVVLLVIIVVLMLIPEKSNAFTITLDGRSVVIKNKPACDCTKNVTDCICLIDVPIQ